MIRKLLPKSCRILSVMTCQPALRDVEWGRTTVKYSRTEPSYAVCIFALFFFYLLILVQDLIKEVRDLAKKVRDLEKTVTSIESRMQSQEHTMLAWQTSNLVFHGALSLFHSFSLFNHSAYLHSVALGTFAWNELADETKAQLAEHSIIDCKSNVQARRSMLDFVVVPGLFYLQSSKEHGVAEVAARMAYRSMHRDISRYAPIIIQFKKNAGENRAKIAHPTVSQTYLDEFINGLGGSEPNLSPLEVRLFDHLRTTSISTSNIQRATG